VRLARGGTLAIVLAALAVAMLACSAGARRDPAPAPRNPLAGRALYANPNSPTARAVAQLQTQGNARDAQTLQRIASRQVGTWFGNDSADLTSQVQTLTSGAAAVRQLPLLVVYQIPNRDCSGYSSGGAPDGRAYLDWIRRLAAAIGTRPAIVILEPDALAGAVQGCLPRGEATARLGLIRDAVAILTQRPHAAVYIDAGNSRWVTHLRRMARALRAAGIARAAGFSVNVSNFFTTGAAAAYGRRLSRLLGGSHFVIDTGRNGHGPDARGADEPTWCNPPGRALGNDPTTSPGQPYIDAYLWVKPPGNSDGTCRPGAPSAGQFWLQYALGLVAASRP
jgi:endoglucanase